MILGKTLEESRAQSRQWKTRFARLPVQLSDGRWLWWGWFVERVSTIPPGDGPGRYMGPVVQRFLDIPPTETRGHVVPTPTVPKTADAWKANCQSNAAAMAHVEEAFGQILPAGVKSGDHRADPEPMTWAADLIAAMHEVKAHVARVEAERDALRDRLENAGQAMAETQRSWEHRCHAIMAALELDFGGPTPDIPEQDSWYARNLQRAEDRAFEAELKLRQAEAVVWEEVLLWMQGIANPTMAQSSQAMARNYVERIAAILTPDQKEPKE